MYPQPFNHPRWWALGLALVAVLTQLSNANTSRPQFGGDGEFYVAAFASTLTLDGKLDEAAWQGTDSINTITDEEWLTTIRFLHDKDMLYIGAWCRSHDPGNLLINYKEHGSKNWRDDCIELFIDGLADFSGYRQACMNAGGYACLVGRGLSSGAGGVYRKHQTLEGATFATHVDKDFWSLEAAIPLEHLQMQHAQGVTFPFALSRHIRETSLKKPWRPWGNPRQLPKMPRLLLANSTNAGVFGERHRQQIEAMEHWLARAKEMARNYTLAAEVSAQIQQVATLADGLNAFKEALITPDFSNRQAVQNVAALEGRLLAATQAVDSLKWMLTFAPYFDEPGERARPLQTVDVASQLPAMNDDSRKTRRDGEWAARIDQTIRTPHVPWATPLAGPPIKAGLIVTRPGAREAMELKQRLHMDFEAVVAWTPTLLGVSDFKADFDFSSHTEKCWELHSLLQRDLDLLVIGNLEWSAIPEVFRHVIMRKVHQGMGLVTVFADPNEPAYEWRRVAERQTSGHRQWVTQGLPMTQINLGFDYYGNPKQDRTMRLNADDAANFAPGATLGEGRIVQLPYLYPDTLRARGNDQNYTVYGGTSLAPHVDYAGHNYHHFEYHMMLLARACMWAAKREGGVAAPASLSPLKAGVADSLSLKFACKRSLKTSARLEYTVRDDRFGVVMHAGEQQLALKGKTAAANIAMPPMPAGSYLVEYRLLVAGEVASFGAPLLLVQGDGAVEQIAIDRQQLRQGTLAVTARVPFAKGQVAVTDNLGRLLIREPVNVIDGRLEAKLPMPAAQTTIHRLDVIGLNADGHPTAVGRQEFIVDDVPRPDYYFGPFVGLFGTRQSQLMYRRLSEDFGQNLIYNLGVVRSYGAATTPDRHGLNHLVVAGHIAHAKYPDAAYKKRLYQGTRHAIKRMDKWGLAPVAITMGDEACLDMTYKELPLIKDAIPAFRQWLQKRFGNDLNALNAHWGSDFATWNDVTPVELRHAYEKGEFVRWYDGWLHLEDAFQQLLVETRDIAKERFPDTPFGFELFVDNKPGSGYNCPKNHEVVDFSGCYPRWDAWETARAFRAPGSTFFSMNHPRMPDPEGRQGEWIIWSSVFHQFEGHLYHRLDGSFGYLAMGYDLSIRRRPGSAELFPEGRGYSPLLRYPIEFDSMSANAKEANLGAAKLVHEAKRTEAEVAVLYSNPSTYAVLAFESDGGKDIRAGNLAPWIHFETFALLKDCHVDYRWLLGTTTHEERWWEEAGIKMLILPYTPALDAKTVAGIRAFVKAGGVLLAGVRPGIMDENLRSLDHGQLDDVFGVTSAAPDMTPLTSGVLATSAQGKFPQIKYDPHLRTGAGKAKAAIGETPLLITHRYGKGTAYLWNMLPRYTTSDVHIGDLLDSWGRRFKEGPLGYPAQRQLMRKALAQSGVQPPVTFVGESDDVQATELFAFQRGQTQLLGLARRNYRLQFDTDILSLKAPSDAYIYDVRNKRFLGHGQAFEAAVRAGGAGLYAFLPYAVKGVTVAATADANHIRVTAGIDGATSNDIYHVLRIEVSDAAGQAQPALSRNIVLNGAQVVHEVPLALNAPAGDWTVTVRDVISNKFSRATVAVGQRSPGMAAAQ